MQNIVNFFQESSALNITEIVINILLAAAMSQIVYVTFIKFAGTFSNRKQFGKIFFMITVCTTVIISVIHASIALSLGLVGALSIVRFRTAIKEPEELAYVFFCITIGLGFGANARGLTLISAFLILSLIVLKGLVGQSDVQRDTFNFSIVSSVLSLEQILKAVKRHSESSILRRVDNDANACNVQLIVEFLSTAQLQEAIDALKEDDPDVCASFISNSTFV